MNLQFGLNGAIPGTVETAWGARFIFPDDIVFDRQDLKGTDTGKVLLIRWLNSVLPLVIRTARHAAINSLITPDGNQMVILHKDEQGVVVACPGGSYGYLYVSAWMHNGDADKMPTPEFKNE